MSAFHSDRRDFLYALLGGTAGLCFTDSVLAQAPSGQATPPQINPIKLTKLTDNIAVLSGDGGNVGLILENDALMMIDGGLPERSPELLKAIAENFEARKVQILFDTHYHFDHIGSNEELGRRGAKILAHENVRKQLSITFMDEAFGRTFEALKPEGIPKETFAKAGKLTFGKEKVVYTHFPDAHTDGDSYVYFPNSNILHTGDLFWNGLYPVIDYSTKGWIGGMVAACDEMNKVGDALTRIIPGHGPLGSKQDLNSFRDMLATVHERLEPLAKQGMTVEEVIAAGPTKDLDEKWGKIRTPEAFLRQAYPSLLRRKLNT